MAFNVGVGKFTNADPRRAAIERAKIASSTAKPEDAALIRYISPAECTDRIRIEFDDSGSMSGQIENAKKGVVEFLKNCIPNQTAVAVHFMNTASWSTSLRSDLPQLAVDVQGAFLNSGGTPFFNCMKKMLEATPRTTRLVVFTDGAPTDQLCPDGDSGLQYGYETVYNTTDPWLASADIIITIAKSFGDKCIPIDTVYFGSAHREREISLLKYLSDKTGGFFLHFDPSKANIWNQLKYLAPVNRLRLTDGAFRASVERGDAK